MAPLAYPAAPSAREVSTAVAGDRRGADPSFPYNQSSTGGAPARCGVFAETPMAAARRRPVEEAMDRRGVPPPLSVAPMMNRTDRHFRFFVRAISRRVLLYTEMITTAAVLRGDRQRLLGFDAAEKPLALQLGGDDPRELADCARLAQDLGYDEVNLNVGCPSDRVQRGRFGACLMADPHRVSAAVAAMRAAVDLPVTVKHRIGIDHRDSYEDLFAFVSTVAEAGCDRFSIHARKAWLRGLSPKQNRTVPPLRYEEVYRLKVERPDLSIEINGGIRSWEEIRAHLQRVDAVMIGRAAYEDPFLFAPADRCLFGAAGLPPTRALVVERLLPYIEGWRRRDLPLHRITRHLHGLFAGQPGARAWRRHLSEQAHRSGAGPEVVQAALEQVPEEVRGAPPQPIGLEVPAGQGALPGGSARL